MSMTDIPSETAPASEDAMNGSPSLADNPSSYTLKLFHHQSIVTYASREDPTFRTPSATPVYNATIRALNILEVATIVATYLLPRPIPPRESMHSDNVHSTHRDITRFGHACTSLYMSAMRILYRRIFWLPSLWWILIDKYASLAYPYTDMVVTNRPILLLVLRILYDDDAITKQPESVVAYKFRRFLFITAQVRSLNIDNADLSPEVLQYVTSLLPKHRKTLLPGLRTTSWLDDEYLIPTFLSLSPNRTVSSSLSNTQELDGSPDDSPDGPPDGLSRDSQSLQPWLPFDTDTIRTLNLQMHTFVSPTDRSANHELFLASIQRLGNQCRSAFPRLDRLMFLICRHKYHMPSVLSRYVTNAIARVVLETDVVPLSAGIPPPPSTLPFRREHLQNGAYVEGIAVHGYLSHAPVLNAAGETAAGPSPPDAYPIFSAHLVTSSTVLAVACTTNMTTSSINDKHVICRMLSPAVDFLALETLVLHFEKISLRLSHGDLAFIAEKWKNIRTLDLRFKTIIMNEHLDIIKASSVQLMTKPDSADRLKRLHLPELDIRNFHNLMKYRQDTLTTLTSSVLHFNDHEIKDVCAALLTAYPNLTTVTGPGSAPQWSKFAEVLEHLREKRRVERANRDLWLHVDVVYARVLISPRWFKNQR